MSERRYLPTLAELIDRLSITLQKRIFIPGHKDEYAREIADIKHDIDLVLDGFSTMQDDGARASADFIYATLVLMLTNRFIWENEGAVRRGEGMDLVEIGRRLRATHSVNGVRNTAKNIILDAIDSGGRKDYKIDALAADLPPDMGDWNVFD
jgi:hypothetical protein